MDLQMGPAPTHTSGREASVRCAAASVKRPGGQRLFLLGDTESPVLDLRAAVLHGRNACVARDGQVGPRVLKTMLALLEMMRLVDSWRGTDRRVKHYRPTPRLLDFTRGFYVTPSRALDCLEPEARRAERLLHDREFFSRLLVTAGREHHASPPASRMPGFIAFFGGRDGVGPITARLVEAELLGAPPDSRATLARRFGLSRTQVSDVIAEGVRVGYFGLDADASPSVTPQLRENLSRWISIELAFMARHMPPPRSPQ